MAKITKMSLEEILSIDPTYIGILTRREIEHIFKVCNAFWRHPGKKNITAPHARLTTGVHSNIYVNCPLVLCHSNLCQIHNTVSNVCYIKQMSMNGIIFGSGASL